MSEGEDSQEGYGVEKSDCIHFKVAGVLKEGREFKNIKEDQRGQLLCLYAFLPLLTSSTSMCEKKKKKKKQPLFEKVARKVYLQEDPGVGVVNQSEFQGKFRM